MERITGNINASNPAEYLEALLRICEQTLKDWESLPDGDGVGSDAYQEDSIATKTAMFRIIRGCAGYGLMCLRAKYMVDNPD